jgi:antitoxin (DNA-binding transcriptional repressor) of toxin-antitoxin stability system
VETVGIRELTQNPLAVVQRVLDAGEPVKITTHGHPTGVSLVPDAPSSRRWVRGAELGRVRPMGHDAAERLHHDLAGLDEDEPADPREARA